MFGDQFDFAGLPISNLAQDSAFGVIADHYGEQGIRGMIIRVNSESAGISTDDLYRSADGMGQWIEAEPLALRYKNGSSLSQAGSSGKIAVALGLDGSACLGGDAFRLKLLAKLGVNFLILHSEEDPVFTGESLSPFGEKILEICNSEGVTIHWSVNKPSASEVLARYKGPVIVEKSCPVFEEYRLQKVKKLLDQKNRLLILRCGPGTDDKVLVQYVASLEGRSVHLDFTGTDASDGKGPVTEDKNWENHLAQAVYDAVLTRSDRKAAYNRMSRLMGGNLRAILK
jgi:hypothetical protein